MHERVLDGRASLNRKRILGEDSCQFILEWVSIYPQDYKFESCIWQMLMIISMIRDKLGISVQPRTLRRALRHAGISFRKSKTLPV